MKVVFLNYENGNEHSTEMSADEFRIIVELKPEISVDGNVFETVGEFYYNIDMGHFVINIFSGDE